MGGARNTLVVNDKFVVNFCRNTSREETAWNSHTCIEESYTSENLMRYNGLDLNGLGHGPILCKHSNGYPNSPINA